MKPTAAVVRVRSARLPVLVPASLALLLCAANCAPRYADISKSDIHGFSEVAVVVRPSPRTRHASPAMMSSCGCLGGAVGWGIAFLVMRGEDMSMGSAGSWVYTLAAMAGGGLGTVAAEALRLGETQGDTLGMNVARMTAERFMELAAGDSTRWPRMALTPVDFGTPVESLPRPRIQFAAREVRMGPNLGLTCIIATSVFDGEGSLVSLRQKKYSSSEQGKTPPRATILLDLVSYYRKEMQNCADSVASDIVRNLK